MVMSNSFVSDDCVNDIISFSYGVDCFLDV